MLRYKKSFGLIFFAILLFSCSENKLSQNDKIIGTWTRVGDNYSRMKVTVEKNNNIVFGKIVFLPTLAQKNGFVFNDIKWKKKSKVASSAKDNRYLNLADSLGRKNVYQLMRDYYNKDLAEMVLNKKEILKIYETENRFVQKKDPIFSRIKFWTCSFLFSR